MNNILEDFNRLTQIEIQVHLDTLKNDPEKYTNMSTASIMAIKRCRVILEILLQGRKYERVK